MHSNNMTCLDIARMLKLDDDVISAVEKYSDEIDFSVIKPSADKLLNPPQ